MRQRQEAQEFATLLPGGMRVAHRNQSGWHTEATTQGATQRQSETTRQRQKHDRWSRGRTWTRSRSPSLFRSRSSTSHIQALRLSWSSVVADAASSNTSSGASDWSKHSQFVSRNRPRTDRNVGPHFQPHFQPHFKPHFEPKSSDLVGGVDQERVRSGRGGVRVAPQHQPLPARRTWSQVSRIKIRINSNSNRIEIGL